MGKQYIYPSGIEPRCKLDPWALRTDQTNNVCGKEKLQPLSRNPSWDNVCKDNDTVIAWGDIRPDAVDHNAPIYSANFHNMITTKSGSYNTPTRFSTTGWSNVDDIPNSAKIKAIKVCYAWDQVNIFNSVVTWKRNEICGKYPGGGGYFSGKVQLVLNIGGQTLTESGPNVRNHNYARKNKNAYTTAELGGEHKVSFSGFNNLTMKHFKNSKLTFIPTPNEATDIARIVMRHLRVYVEWEDVPSAFNIADLTVKPNSVTNCPAQKSTVTVTLKNTSPTPGTTQVNIGGSGMTNATIDRKDIITEGSDTFVKDSKNNIWIWNVKNNCQSRKLTFKTSYKIPNTYTIRAIVKKNKGTVTDKKKGIQVIETCKPTWNFEYLSNEKVTNNKFTYSINDSDANNTVYFRLTLKKSKATSDNENMTVDMDGLEFSGKIKITTNTETNDVKSTRKENIYTFSNIAKYTKVIISGRVILNETGLYNVVGKYNNTTNSKWNMKKSYKIDVAGAPILKKDFFKLRVEDGSDIKYNSLMITEGDDLLKPLTYTTEEVDEYISKMTIEGETKRIPVKETQYIHFNIKLNTTEKVELKNVLTYIDVYNSNTDMENIIVGAGKGVSLLENDEEHICLIESISSEKPTVVRLAVNSEVEDDDVVVKIKPYNYDGYTDKDKWIPSHIMFKDIPNIKISISGISELMYAEDEPNGKDVFTLYYKIQNLSNVKAEKVRFQLKEPQYFSKMCYVFQGDDDCKKEYNNNKNMWFNKNNRIITFETLEPNSAEYILSVKYKAQKRGIYDFVIHTLDSNTTLVDDQYENSYTHTVMVNVPNDVHIITDVSNTLPYVNEVIDFHIKVKNLHKEQKHFTFNIYDIGSYGSGHQTNDYCIEYVKCKNGTFTPMHGTTYKYPTSHQGNMIGKWQLDDIGINDEYDLIISVRPKDNGYHIFKTIFTDQFQNKKEFYNEVRVLEPNKQIDFNVYHAIDEKGTACNNCNDLIQICDDDFINLGDDIYYVFEIKNNNRNKINNAIHVYARVPESFLENDILCSSYNYILNQTSNLISFTIPELQGCQHDNSTIKFCIRLKPAEIGKFISTFSLSTRNSKVLYKQLKLTVDTEFNERQLEHSIKIYNFEKTNRHYRYEIDNIGNLFKFFNTGDKTLRPIEIERFSKKSVEEYKGTNLRDIAQQIKRKSKYVDPVFLREGTNKLATKGYELFPDGLIRRFGLLNSEVYHYSGQFPTTTDLIDRAMKWDIDNWDEKVWAGGDYDNGVFSLSIDYSKVPKNFNILDVDRPINNLQNLVDNVKPYGTKAICRYATTVYANFKINIDNVIKTIKYDIHTNLSIPNNFSVMTSFNRFDGSTKILYELPHQHLHYNIDKVIEKRNQHDKNIKTIKSNIDSITSCIFADKTSKTYTKDCYDLISNAYSQNAQARNIDITKPFTEEYSTETNESLSSIQVLNFDVKNNVEDKKPIGFIIEPYSDTSILTLEPHVNDINNTSDNVLYCIYEKDEMDNFEGFKFILNDTIIQERQISETVEKISIQVQMCTENSDNILHFWGSINGKEYNHIGLCMLNDFKQPVCKVYNVNTYQRHSIENDNDKEITFKVSNKIKNIHKSPDIIQPIQKNNKWQHLYQIGKNNNKYAYFSNNINIDPECGSKEINVPKLMLKYNNINIDDLDEIVDIHFKIEAQSNKDSFPKDININLFKDGDKYIPENNIAREINYPEVVQNVLEDFITTVDVEQDNVTICSKCLKTALGCHDVCPYCGSTYVQYSDEQMAATACYNCDWIVKGWNDYCTHCLSNDVEKILIDYNKTYCNECKEITGYDYYERCPKCFSNDVIHLTNNVHRYQIFGAQKQNIEPIIVKTNEQQVNTFSLYLPFNKNTTELQQLQKFNLQIHGTNNNDGKYYYCEACGSGGVGNYERCPYCNSKLIQNKTLQNQAIHTTYQVGDTYLRYEDMITSPKCLEACPTDSEYNINIPAESFTKEIDILKCACHNNLDRFKLNFTIENQLYDHVSKEILKLPIKEQHQAQIIDKLSSIDISIDNLSLDYKYKNTYEWKGLDALEHDDHTGIFYHVSKQNSTTEPIMFKKFNIPSGEYKHAKLYISGLLKNITNNINMHIVINSNDEVHQEITTSINNTLFTYEKDILNTDKYIENMSVTIYFSNIEEEGDIVITSCNIMTEWEQYDTLINENINKISSSFINESTSFLFKPLNNLWGLKDTQPYYLSGRQLKTNLIGYIDFGKLDLDQYIRLYNIDMVLYYKSKNGNLVTDTISLPVEDNTFETILTGAGCTPQEIETAILNNTSLSDTLRAKDKEINSEYIKQLLSANINKNRGELWGGINHGLSSLNNLDYEVTNINDNEELINDIPLYYKIAQSFNTKEQLTSIDTVSVNYFGKKGYPNESIDVFLCQDNNGQPGNIIASTKASLTNAELNLVANFDVYDLKQNTQYWIVLQDVSADKNNYHRFHYNKNNDIGNLITYKNNNTVHEDCVLSFSISRIKTDRMFCNLPVTWIFNNDYDSYKIHYGFYRYNIQEDTNVELSNFIIKSGYSLSDTKQQSPTTSTETTATSTVDTNIVDESDIEEDEDWSDDDINPYYDEPYIDDDSWFDPDWDN